VKDGQYHVVEPFFSGSRGPGERDRRAGAEVGTNEDPLCRSVLKSNGGARGESASPHSPARPSTGMPDLETYT
jgi:hypothetical protein